MANVAAPDGPPGRATRRFVIEPDPAFRADLLALADEANTRAGAAFASGHDIQGTAYLGAAEWLTRRAYGETA